MEKLIPEFRSSNIKKKKKKALLSQHLHPTISCLSKKIWLMTSDLCLPLEELKSLINSVAVRPLRAFETKTLNCTAVCREIG